MALSRRQGHNQASRFSAELGCVYRFQRRWTRGYENIRNRSRRPCDLAGRYHYPASPFGWQAKSNVPVRATINGVVFNLLASTGWLNLSPDGKIAPQPPTGLRIVK